MRPFLCLLFLVSVAYAQKYEGYVGFVTAHRVKIDVNRWTKQFVGTFEFVPGIPLLMRGTVRDGWFKSNQWGPTRVRFSNQSIVGDGVWLFRK